MHGLVKTIKKLIMEKTLNKHQPKNYTMIQQKTLKQLTLFKIHKKKLILSKEIKLKKLKKLKKIKQSN